MTKDETTSLRELVEKASPLPWRIGRMVGVGTLEHVVDMGEPPKAPWMALADGRASSGGMTGWPASGVVHSDDGSSADNARLIVAAVNALPGLLDENDELRARALSAEGEVERLKAEFRLFADRVRDCPPGDKARVSIIFNDLREAARLSIGKGNGECIPGSSSTAASSSISSDFGQVKP